MRKETLTCRTHCIYWNSIDKDCELYGENHLRPTNCISFWLQKIKVGRIFKQEDKEIVESLKKVLPMIEFNQVAYDYLDKIIKDFEKGLEDVAED